MTRSHLFADIDTDINTGTDTDRTGTTMSGYSLFVAKEAADIAAAQRLRYRVFGEELGAQLHSTEAGLDADHFDDFCDHILVRHVDSGEIVGTYRMLPPDRVAAAGTLYSDVEFDLSRLSDIRNTLVETGRSCVHPDHRNGTVVSLVWAGIARYMLLSGHRFLIGCASVPVGDGGARAASVWEYVRTRHHADEHRSVTPLTPFPVEAGAQARAAAVPPLLRGYLRLGAVVCGPPAHDRDFGVADFFVLLDLHRIDPRYLRFFLGENS